MATSKECRDTVLEDFQPEDDQASDFRGGKNEDAEGHGRGLITPGLFLGPGGSHHAVPCSRSGAVLPFRRSHDRASMFSPASGNTVHERV